MKQATLATLANKLRRDQSIIVTLEDGRAKRFDGLQADGTYAYVYNPIGWEGQVRLDADEKVSYNPHVIRKAR